jgi:hypothetical protein
MSSKFRRKVSTITTGVLMSVPGVALAAPNPGSISVTTNNNQTISGLAGDIINNVLLPVAGAIAVIFLIIGGIRYILSAGSSDQIEKAKHTIIYSVVGIIVIIFSYVIVAVLQKTF